MAGAFVITAQIQLQGPANLQNVVSNIQKQLGGISAQVNLKVPPNIANQFGSATNQAKGLKSALNGINATSMNKVAQGVASVGQNAVVAKTAAFEFGEAIGLAGRKFAAFSLAAGTLVGAIAAIKNGVSAALDFQHEMVRLEQVSSDSAATISGVAKTITNLSTSLGASSAELSKVAVTLRQAGLSSDDVEKALQAVAKASIAPTFTDIENTVEGTIAVMQQFNVQAANLEGVLGAINKVSADFAVESDDIVHAIRRSGGAFKAAGGNLNELMALFTSVRQTTRESAETIASGFNTIFARVQRPQTVDQLKLLGINLRYTKEEAEAFGKTEGEFVGPYEAVRRLNQVLSSVPPASQEYASVVEAIGGFRQVSKVIPLIQQFGVAERALNSALSGTGSLEQSQTVAQKSFTIQIAKLKEEFLSLFRTLTGNKVLQQYAHIFLEVASAIAKVLKIAEPLIPLLSTLAIAKAATTIGYLGNKGFGAGLRRGLSSNRPYAGGGVVPGEGNTDSVHASLMPGEFVIRKSSARRIGYENLHRMNRYAEGGHVKEDDDIDDPLLKSMLEGMGDRDRQLFIRQYKLSKKLKRGNLLKPQHFLAGGDVKDENDIDDPLLKKMLEGMNERDRQLYIRQYKLSQKLKKGNLLKPQHFAEGGQVEQVAGLEPNQSAPVAHKKIDRLIIKPSVKGSRVFMLTTGTLKKTSNRETPYLPVNSLVGDAKKRYNSDIAQITASQEKLVANQKITKEQTPDIKSITVPITVRGIQGKPKKEVINTIRDHVGGSLKTLSSLFAPFTEDIKITKADTNRIINFAISNNGLGRIFEGFVQMIGQKTRVYDNGKRPKFVAKSQSEDFDFDPINSEGINQLFGGDLIGQIADVKWGDNFRNKASMINKAVRRFGILSSLPDYRPGNIPLLSKVTTYKKEKGKIVYNPKTGKPVLRSYITITDLEKIAKRNLSGKERLFRLGDIQSFQRLSPELREDVEKLRTGKKSELFKQINPFQLKQLQTAFGEPEQKNKGGKISAPSLPLHLAVGGSVGSDTVPAMLTPGEYVFSREASQHIGYNNLERMNKLARGGIVEPVYMAEGGLTFGDRALQLFNIVRKKKNKETGEEKEVTGFLKTGVAERHLRGEKISLPEITTAAQGEVTKRIARFHEHGQLGAGIQDHLLRIPFGNDILALIGMGNVGNAGPNSLQRKYSDVAEGLSDDAKKALNKLDIKRIAVRVTRHIISRQATGDFIRTIHGPVVKAINQAFASRFGGGLNYTFTKSELSGLEGTLFEKYIQSISKTRLSPAHDKADRLFDFPEGIRPSDNFNKIVLPSPVNPRALTDAKRSVSHNSTTDSIMAKYLNYRVAYLARLAGTATKKPVTKITLVNLQKQYQIAQRNFEKVRKLDYRDPRYVKAIDQSLALHRKLSTAERLWENENPGQPSPIQTAEDIRLNLLFRKSMGYGYAGGGKVRATPFSAGGLSRGTDTVPASLTPGEFIINRNSAQAIGYNTLDQFNHYADGGQVKSKLSNVIKLVQSNPSFVKVRDKVKDINKAVTSTNAYKAYTETDIGYVPGASKGLAAAIIAELLYRHRRDILRATKKLKTLRFQDGGRIFDPDDPPAYVPRMPTRKFHVHGRDDQNNLIVRAVQAHDEIEARQQFLRTYQDQVKIHRVQEVTRGRGLKSWLFGANPTGPILRAPARLVPRNQQPQLQPQPQIAFEPPDEIRFHPDLGLGDRAYSPEEVVGYRNDTKKKTPITAAELYQQHTPGVVGLGPQARRGVAARNQLGNKTGLANRKLVGTNQPTDQMVVNALQTKGVAPQLQPTKITDPIVRALHDILGELQKSGRGGRGGQGTKGTKGPRKLKGPQSPDEPNPPETSEKKKKPKFWESTPGTLLKGAAIAASQYAPEISESIFGTVQKPGALGLGGVKAGSAATGAIAGIGQGVAVGSLVGGPVGAAIGAAVGGFRGLVTALNETNKQIKEIDFSKSMRGFELAIETATNTTGKLKLSNLDDLRSGLDKIEKGAKESGDRLNFFAESVNPQQLSQVQQRLIDNLDLTTKANPQERLDAFYKAADGLGGQLARLQQEAEKVSPDEYNKRTQELLTRAAQSQDRKQAEIDLAKLVDQQSRSFTSLITATDEAVAAVKNMHEAVSGFRISLAEGQRVTPFIPQEPVKIGSSDTTAFDRTIRFISASLGRAGGDLTKDFEETARGFNKAALILPGALKELQARGISDENIGTGLRDILSRSKDIPEKVRETLSHAIADIGPERAIESIKKSPEAFGKDLIERSAPTLNNAVDIQKQLLEHFDRFNADLAKVQDLHGQAADAQSHVVELQGQRVQTQREIFAQRIGAPSLAEPSRFQVAAQTFNLQQQQLAARTNIQGEAAFDPQAIGRALDDIVGEMETSQKKLAHLVYTDPTGKRTQEAAIEFSRLSDASVSAQKALHNLADASSRVSAIQDRLGQIQQEESNRLSFAERYATSTMQEKARLQYGYRAAQVATAQGGLQGFNIETKKLLFEVLHGLENIPLQEFGGLRGGEVTQNLLRSDQEAGQFANLAPVQQREKTGLQDNLVRQLDIAAKAQQTSADFQRQNQEKFFTDLTRIQSDFFTRLDRSVLAQQTEEVKGQLEGDKARVIGIQTKQEAGRGLEAAGFKDFDQLRRLLTDIDKKDLITERTRAGVVRSLSDRSIISKELLTPKSIYERMPIEKEVMDALRKMGVEPGGGQEVQNSLFGGGPTTATVLSDKLVDLLQAHPAASQLPRNQLIEISQKVAHNAVYHPLHSFRTLSKDLQEEVKRAYGGEDIERGYQQHLVEVAKVHGVHPQVVEQALTQREDLQKKLDVVGAVSNVGQLTDEFNKAQKSVGEVTQRFNELSAQLDNFNKRLGIEAPVQAQEQAAPKTGFIAQFFSNLFNRAPKAPQVPQVPHAARGGPISHTAQSAALSKHFPQVFTPRGTDTVAAMLSKGEYVVNARATSKHKGLLEAINNDSGGPVLYKADGGFVGPGYSPRGRNAVTGQDPQLLAKIDRLFLDIPTDIPVRDVINRTSEARTLLERAKKEGINTYNREAILDRISASVKDAHPDDTLKHPLVHTYSSLITPEARPGIVSGTDFPRRPDTYEFRPKQYSGAWYSPNGPRLGYINPDIYGNIKSVAEAFGTRPDLRKIANLVNQGAAVVGSGINLLGMSSPANKLPDPNTANVDLRIDSSRRLKEEQNKANQQRAEEVDRTIQKSQAQRQELAAREAAYQASPAAHRLEILRAETRRRDEAQQTEYEARPETQRAREALTPGSPQPQFFVRYPVVPSGVAKRRLAQSVYFSQLADREKQAGQLRVSAQTQLEQARGQELARSALSGMPVSYNPAAPRALYQLTQNKKASAGQRYKHLRNLINNFPSSPEAQLAIHQMGGLGVQSIGEDYQKAIKSTRQRVPLLEFAQTYQGTTLAKRAKNLAGGLRGRPASEVQFPEYQPSVRPQIPLVQRKQMAFIQRAKLINERRIARGQQTKTFGLASEQYLSRGDFKDYTERQNRARDNFNQNVGLAYRKVSHFVGSFFAQGGPVHGPDKIPVMAAPGEYIVNSAAYRKYGGLVEAINNSSKSGGGPIYRQNGGPVGGGAPVGGGDLPSINLSVDAKEALNLFNDRLTGTVGELSRFTQNFSKFINPLIAFSQNAQLVAGQFAPFNVAASNLAAGMALFNKNADTLAAAIRGLSNLPQTITVQGRTDVIVTVTGGQAQKALLDQAKEEIISAISSKLKSEIINDIKSGNVLT